MSNTLPQLLPVRSGYNIWGIYSDSTFLPVFDVDSVVEVGYKSNARVSNFPVEEGGFASYNKAKDPYKIDIRLAVGGSSDRINVFLAKLESEVSSTNTFTVLLPDQVYLHATIESYRFKRIREKGRNLVQADVSLVEVRRVAPQYTNVGVPPIKNPKNDKSKSNQDKGNKDATAPKGLVSSFMNLDLFNGNDHLLVVTSGWGGTIPNVKPRPNLPK